MRMNLYKNVTLGNKITLHYYFSHKQHCNKASDTDQVVLNRKLKRKFFGESGLQINRVWETMRALFNVNWLK